MDEKKRKIAYPLMSMKEMLEEILEGLDIGDEIDEEIDEDEEEFLSGINDDEDEA